MNVTIPFSQEMAKAAINSKKICTSRREKKGEPGDIFCIEGMDTFRIVDVRQYTLGFITEHFYKLEGVETPFEFIELWKSLHRGHYDPNKLMYVHFFSRL